VLANALKMSGALSEAVDLYHRAIDMVAGTRRGPNQELAILHQHLASACLEARRPVEALAQLQIAEDMAAAAGGDPAAWRARERKLDRAEALIYLGHGDEATALVDAVATSLREDPTHQWSRVAQLRSQLLRLGGQGIAAADLGRTALRRAQDEQLNARSGAALRVALAQSLLDTGQARAARPLLAEAVVLYQIAQVGPSPRVADALVSLGRVDLDLARPESALTSLQRAHDFWREFDPDNPWAAESAYWYGRALLAAGQPDPGSRLIAQARPRLLQSPFAMHRKLATADQAARG
jgi:tetratricopeptide (TPR) repeat protein